MDKNKSLDEQTVKLPFVFSHNRDETQPDEVLFMHFNKFFTFSGALAYFINPSQRPQVA